MIENPNIGGFYSPKEMKIRENYIPKMKADLLQKIKDLHGKIEKEEPFPEGNMNLDFLCEVNDEIEQILNHWHY